MTTPANPQSIAANHVRYHLQQALEWCHQLEGAWAKEPIDLIARAIGAVEWSQSFRDTGGRKAPCSNPQHGPHCCGDAHQKAREDGVKP